MLAYWGSDKIGILCEMGADIRYARGLLLCNDMGRIQSKIHVRALIIGTLPIATMLSKTCVNILACRLVLEALLDE